ncbi:IS110 family transposase [Bacillus massiliigorillae]|uniref:IS110 family transposase n=1 Tax=Bacillus massiliigorillae TaxID=1243664 RepID=UPI0003A7CF02|nr:IS110 family transposase [Bacillus massiliigorillae]
MNPVIGLDVAKGESQVQAFLEKKKPYKKSFKVAHTLEGLHKLHAFIREVEEFTDSKPPIVLESTGHYHMPVVQYFEKRGYLLIIVNPLISYKAKSSSLRKVKTDVIDAYHLCELYYKEDLEPCKKRGILLEYKKHLSKLEEEIDALAKNIEEYKIIQSIPGIGEKIAATIISEIGEIDRFNHPKKLVAFAGIDPSVFESGTFKGTKNHITKRGSSRLRHALFTAVRCAIRDARKTRTTKELIPRNKRLREFYDKKREEGKPYRVSIIACANKLLHWIYALLKNKTTFQDVA